jgi:hypothetical protein
VAWIGYNGKNKPWHWLGETYPRFGGLNDHGATLLHSADAGVIWMVFMGRFF